MSSLTLMGAGPEAGSGAFTPASVTGLMAWYDFSAQSGIDGDPISSVSDLSGNGRTLTQATGTAQPTLKTGANGINGLKVAQFDGTTDFLATANFASPTAGVSFFVVLKFRILPGANTPYVLAHAGAATWVAPFARYALGGDGGTKFQGSVEDVSVGANRVLSTAAIVATAEVRGFVYDQTNMTHYNDGVADGATARSGVLTSSTLPLVLGAHHGTVPAAEWFDGQLGEVVIYDNGISGANITSLSNYFRTKWATP